MTTLGKDDIFSAINGRNDHSYTIKGTSTLTVLDAQGEMLGFCSGDALQAIMVDLINEHLGAVNQERKTRLLALKQQTTCPSIADIVAAIIDPLIDGLSRPHARMLHFCHRVILMDNIDIDQSLWWTPMLVDVFKVHYPGTMHGWQRERTSIVNYCIYHLIGRAMHVDHIGLPLTGRKRTNVHNWLNAIASGILEYSPDQYPPPTSEPGCKE